MPSIHFENEIITEHLNQLSEEAPLGHFGLSAIDKYTGGIHKGRVIVFSGGTGIGKTTLTNQVGDKTASQGFITIVNTLEIPPYLLLAKSLARISNGNCSVSEVPDRLSDPLIQALIQEYLDTVAPNLVFLDKPISAIELKAKIAEIRQTRNEHIVVVQDYLQLMPYSGDKEVINERFIVTSSMEGLRRIANDFDATVIVVSGIIRSGYGKKNPGLGSFSSSSFVEYSADTIIHIAKDPDCSPGIDGTIPIVATTVKNRYGNCGEALLAYNPNYATFYDRTPS